MLRRPSNSPRAPIARPSYGVRIGRGFQYRRGAREVTLGASDQLFDMIEPILLAAQFELGSDLGQTRRPDGQAHPLERVCAAIEWRPGSQPSARDLISWARAQLAPYKVPKDVCAVASLPRNAMGKVIKPDVARLIAAAADVEGKPRG